jgi:glucose-6-phosphate 1-dehydrogenase
LSFMYMQTNDPSDYESLAQALLPFHKRAIYLATPPSLYALIVETLLTNKIIQKGHPHHRIAFEKPFGENQAAANELITLMATQLDESQMYRVDHYLAKPMIDQLLSVRTSLSFLQPLFRFPTLQRVIVRAYETVSIMARGKFYDVTGAMNDMIQSHLLFTLTRACMALPTNVTLATMQEAMSSFLSRLIPDTHHMKTGQYVGYRQEANVGQESRTETFAALPFTHASSEYKGVEFWITTGKRCSQKITDIRFQFIGGGILQYRIAPDIGVHANDAFLALCTPEQQQKLRSIMNQSFVQKEAYETIFYDFIQGDQRLFPSAKVITQAWSIIDQFHQVAPEPIPYTHEHDVWKDES